MTGPRTAVMFFSMRKSAGWLFACFSLLCLSSCGTAPIGGPTSYARQQVLQLSNAPAPDDEEELHVGLFCSGYFCSERYEISAKSFIPLIGGAYPDKPSTPKLFSKKRPYRNLIWLKALSDAQGSDIIVRFNLEKFESRIRADVVSAYTKRSLYQLECKNCLPAIGAQIYDDFKPGTALHKTVVAERAAYFKRLDSSGSAGISKEDLQEIVKAAVAGAAQADKTGALAAAVQSDVDKPSFQLPENVDDFAVVVGIEKYSDLPAAPFAERDASALADHLVALGYPRRNVVLLTGEKAGLSGIAKYVERWLPGLVTEKSRVFFYFSGHGAPDVETGEAYLVPWDGDASFLANTGYPIKRLYQSLNALKAREVIVAMDACFSGAGGRSVLAKGARPLVAKVESLAPESGKVISFSASAGNQISGTVDEQGHGAFTYYFLKGLDGGAQDGAGRVTIARLYDFLRPKVEDAARRQNRGQTPQLMPAAIGERGGLFLK